MDWDWQWSGQVEALLWPSLPLACLAMEGPTLGFPVTHAEDSCHSEIEELQKIGGAVSQATMFTVYPVKSL